MASPRRNGLVLSLLLAACAPCLALDVNGGKVEISAKDSGTGVSARGEKDMVHGEKDMINFQDALRDSLREAFRVVVSSDAFRNAVTDCGNIIFSPGAVSQGAAQLTLSGEAKPGAFVAEFKPEAGSFVANITVNFQKPLIEKDAVAPGAIVLRGAEVDKVDLKWIGIGLVICTGLVILAILGGAAGWWVIHNRMGRMEQRLPEVQQRLPGV
jgi:hypothetical protein